MAGIPETVSLGCGARGAFPPGARPIKVVWGVRGAKPPGAVPLQKSETASVREHRAVPESSTSTVVAVKMTTDSNAPPAPPQDPPDDSAKSRVLWSVNFSRASDIKADTSWFDFFGRWKPRRVRRKQASRSPDGYLSRTEAAGYLGVSLRFMEDNTSIPKINVAGPGSKRATWRYLKSDLDEWMKARGQRGKQGRTD